MTTSGSTRKEPRAQGSSGQTSGSGQSAGAGQTAGSGQSAGAGQSGGQVEHKGSLVPRFTPQDAPRLRGGLQIAPAAVEHVVEGAARQVPGVRPVSRRLGSDRLAVEARVLGQVASVHLQVAVGYPSPVRETCRQLRSTVVDEVRRLAGVEVTRLDLQVAELQHRPGGTRRVR